MKISGKSNAKRRTAYVWQDNDVFFLSPLDASVERRPMNRYDTWEEVEAEVAARGLKLEWNGANNG